MYRLKYGSYFKRKLKKIVSKDKSIRTKFDQTILLIANNPFHPSLKTHKIKGYKNGAVYASRVTGDLRILWKFVGPYLLILADIGGHEGKNSVYK